MPTNFRTFSIATQYRVEHSYDLIGFDGEVATLEFTLGVRRTSGTGPGYSGPLILDMGTEVGPSGGGQGGPEHFQVDFTNTNYIELRRSVTQSGTPGTPWPGEWISTIVTKAVSEPGWGTISASRIQLNMPDVSKATQPSFAPDPFEAGSAITITLPRKDSSYTHDLFYTFGNLRNQFIDSGVGTSYSTTPPLSLLSQIPGAAAGPYTITAVTKDSVGLELGSKSFTGTLTVPTASRPTVSAFNATDSNTVVASAVGAYVQGLSVLKLNSITAAAASGAVITDRRLSVEGANLRIGDTKALLTSGTVPVIARAWDSRGLEGSLGGNLNVLAYVAPSTAAQAFRSNASGTAVDNGSHITISGLSRIKSLVNATERNAMTIRVFTKPLSSATWTARNVLTPTTTSGGGFLSHSAPIVVSGGAAFNPNESYSVRIDVSDKFNTVSLEHTIATSYITVYLDGETVGIAKRRERGALDVGGESYAVGSFSTPPLYGDANKAVFSGQYGTLGGVTLNLPGAPSGHGVGVIDVTRSPDTASDSIVQRYRPTSGIARWIRSGTVSRATQVATLGAWVLDSTFGRASGTTAERLALTGVQTGVEFYDTSTSLTYTCRAGKWMVSPGQVLASMTGPASNTTGAGAVVGSVISTVPLEIGQRVKIVSNFSQFPVSGVASIVATLWRNNASNVTFSTFDGAALSRMSSPATGIVQGGRGCNAIYTTTVAAKVSAAIYTNDANSGVYGADGTFLRIESA